MSRIIINSWHIETYTAVYIYKYTHMHTSYMHLHVACVQSIYCEYIIYIIHRHVYSSIGPKYIMQLTYILCVCIRYLLSCRNGPKTIPIPSNISIYTMNIRIFLPQNKLNQNAGTTLIRNCVGRVR